MSARVPGHNGDPETFVSATVEPCRHAKATRLSPESYTWIPGIGIRLVGRCTVCGFDGGLLPVSDSGDGNPAAYRVNTDNDR